MIQYLLTQLSKKTEFIQKQKYEVQREVIVNRNSTQSKNNNQSDKSFQQMAAADEIILQPESVIKKFQVDKIINKNGSEKQLREVSSDSSISAEKKDTIILGVSMIKHVNGYQVSKKLENCKVLIRSFSGSKVRCMKDHMKPSMRKKPDHVILHIGTNDLNSNRAPELITKSIVDLAIAVVGLLCFLFAKIYRQN